MADETLHPRDRAAILAAQLDAMLTMATRENAAGFLSMSERLQIDALETFSGLAHELRAAVEAS